MATKMNPWTSEQVLELRKQVGKAEQEGKPRKAAFEIVAAERGVTPAAVQAKWNTLTGTKKGKRKARKADQDVAAAPRRVTSLLRELPTSELLKLNKSCADEIESRFGSALDSAAKLSALLKGK